MKRLIVKDKVASLYWVYIIGDSALKLIEEKTTKILNVDGNNEIAKDALKAIEVIKSMNLEMKNYNECISVMSKGASSTIHDKFMVDGKVYKNNKIYTLPGMGVLRQSKNYLNKSYNVNISKDKIIDLIDLAPIIHKQIEKIKKFTDELKITDDLLINHSQTTMNNILKLKKILDNSGGVIESEDIVKTYSKDETYAIYCSIKNKGDNFIVKEVNGYLGSNMLVGSISNAKLFESEKEAQNFIDLTMGTQFRANYAQVVKMNIEFEKVVGEPTIKSNDYSIDILKQIQSEKEKTNISSKIKNNNKFKQNKRPKKI